MDSKITIVSTEKGFRKFRYSSYRTAKKYARMHLKNGGYIVMGRTVYHCYYFTDEFGYSGFRYHSRQPDDTVRIIFFTRNHFQTFSSD